MKLRRKPVRKHINNNKKLSSLVSKENPIENSTCYIKKKKRQVLRPTTT